MKGEKRKKNQKFFRSIALSSIILSILNLIIIGSMGSIPNLLPRCTTLFYHFNIDYRLGLEEVEDRIIREPYHEILKLYDKHPNWKFTIECQAEMMLKIYTTPDYEEIKDLTNKLLERNQMELMCALQFSQLFYAYPKDVFELNLKLANETLESLGLLDKRSNCILFQEGQYAPGLVTTLNSPHASNIDTVLVSVQQIKGFRNPNRLHEDYPVYIVQDENSGKSIKLLQYDYFPRKEAGYFHTWNYLYDAELAFEDEEAEEEFTVSQEKVKAFEEEMLLLEQQGNEFFTCSVWVSHCEEVGAVGLLDYYIPESNWNTADYNSSYTWCSNNRGSSDDGEVLANNYRCRQIILATRTIYERYKNAISLGIQGRIETLFLEAEKAWLQATCTDSTGLTPRYYERQKAEDNILFAQKKCAQILRILGNNVNSLNRTCIQVDLKTGEIYRDERNFISLFQFEKGNIPLSTLPINMQILVVNESASDNIMLQPSISLLKYRSLDTLTLLETFQVYRVDVIIRGSHDWADDSIKKVSIKIQFKEGAKNFNSIIYSPPLTEEEVKLLNREDYNAKPLYIFLPLSNGLFFVPFSEDSNEGIAFIKDISKRHVSWLWEVDYLEILETNGLHLDAHHRFYILENVTIQRALKFANRINLYPPWVVSKDVSLMQGNEIYGAYESMKNKEY
ncbi:MAG: hypothetical protein ACTSXH_03210 [Promethearchaeota archaeon]